MSVAFIGKIGVRCAALTLALALVAPGCGPAGEPDRPEAPPNPAHRADLGKTVLPKFPRKNEPEEPKGVSKVEKDLKKDLGGPMIKPSGTSNSAPPVPTPDAVKNTTAPPTANPPAANPPAGKAGAP